MELTNQLQQVFKFFDGNGDGKISPAELRRALVNLGHDKSTVGKEAERMVREMDSDGDGFIDLDEFMKVMDSVEKEDNLVDAFSVFDCDKNGLISPQELKRVLVRLGSSNCSLRECKKMIKGVDKDGDGFISFQEFKLMMGVID